MKIVFENENIVCKYKPCGVHTLAYSDASLDESLALYRLDKATSGLVVFAKSKEILDSLKDLQKKGEVKKLYKATVTKDENTIFFDKRVSFRIEDGLPFSFSSYFRPYKEGRIAVKTVFEEDLLRYKDKDVTNRLYTTEFLEFKDNVVLCRIDKGFRHQIRVHLATMGYPIVNDTLYQFPYVKSDSIMLECFEVTLGDLCISCRGMQPQP